MKRLIAIIFITLLIIGATIWEQIFLNTTYDELKRKVETLSNSVYSIPNDEINTEFNINLVNELYDYWINKEKTLLYLIKHTEIYQTSDAIIYAKNFIEFKNKEETMNALSKLKYLIETRKYSLGLSSQNFI